MLTSEKSYNDLMFHPEVLAANFLRSSLTMRNPIITLALISVALLPAGYAFSAPADPAAAVEKPMVPPTVMETTSAGKELRAVWTKADFQFNPEVKAAYLVLAKSEALKELVAADKKLPDDFLVWVDNDPIVAASVYGSAQPAAPILCLLRSLEIDLGKEVVRKKYTQLALTMAIANVHVGMAADITDRPLLNLVVPPNPLKPIDTTDPNRVLDQNDHIINFLASVPVHSKGKVQPTKTVQIPNVTDPKKPTTEEVPDLSKPLQDVDLSRPAFAYEVLHSDDLKAKFNAYMEAKGQKARIGVVRSPLAGVAPPKERAAVLGYTNMFKQAYIAKGLLPAGRDATPSLAESCAMLIRNHEYVFPEGKIKRAWPLFPLNAPWPVTTLLAMNRQPLREIDDLWARYRDNGQRHTGCAYKGQLAQYTDLLQAASMRPFDFGYGSVQMMLKDGGVCGTISGISANNLVALGQPASTASQPSHCAYIYFGHDAKADFYACGGGNFVTGGVAQTNPHQPWIFNGGRGQRPMLYHQVVAFMVNHGFQKYLDSMTAYKVMMLLHPDERNTHGFTLAISGLKLNPYNVTLTEAAYASAATSQQQFELMKTLDAGFVESATRPGNPPEGLYTNAVHNRYVQWLAANPVSEDKALNKKIYDALLVDKFASVPAKLRYQVADEGLPATIASIEKQIKEHLLGSRTHAESYQTSLNASAMLAMIPDEAERKALASKWQQLFVGNEGYIGPKNIMATNLALTAIAKLSGETLPDTKTVQQSVLDHLSNRLTASLKGEYEEANTNAIIALMRTVLPQVQDEAQKFKWLHSAIAIVRADPRLASQLDVIEKATWVAVKISSQSNRGNDWNGRGYAAFALDGNPATIWHTFGRNHNPAVDKPPHFLEIDMGEEKTLKGFTYMPRKHLDGMVDHVAFSTSMDGVTWTLAKDIQFEGMSVTSETQRVPFPPVKARFIKFEAKHVMANNYIAVAEIGVIE